MIYYYFTLSEVAVVLGILYVLSHGFAFLKFEAARDYLTSFHRNKREGYILFFATVAWVVWILASTDLMEYSNIRPILILVTLIIAGFVSYYLVEYLAVRSLGTLLLLGAKVLLDAAFLRDEPMKFVITIAAYIYAVVGIVLVASPYRFRDIVKWIYACEKRAKIAMGAGFLFGAVLLVLGIFFY